MTYIPCHFCGGGMPGNPCMCNKLGSTRGWTENAPQILKSSGPIFTDAQAAKRLLDRHAEEFLDLFENASREDAEAHIEVLLRDYLRSVIKSYEEPET